MFESKETASIPNQVYTRLKSEILSLKLKPGQSIGENEIANRFNVSRTPVRDAFKRLEYEHLLEIKSHRSTVVSLIDINFITDIIYIREKLEYAVIEELCKNFSKNKIFKLQLILKKQENLFSQNLSLEDLSRQFIEADNEFHNMIYQLANKENILNFIKSISHHYERFRVFVNFTDEENLYKLYEQHKALYECMVSNNLDTLKELFSQHLYEGIYRSSEKVFEYPEYFKELDLNH
ncbi:DNA-binding GntR family transcriptional regulator [Natranaerovirga hydrolytica]|uniref:DNA-binding GntR family transcriptional regulator n=1 Tax=Natranaerovirga hydrolytica TaxID=680378 RepID=A0A4R1MKI5_9FIRM|nr:GntR family transcriptional regulator [Natranaerovirga hydrolytica]TCK93236.1 DNA-binding GntR family transcriptional regulator [Natranaerovirga hydrolytica]